MSEIVFWRGWRHCGSGLSERSSARQNSYLHKNAATSASAAINPASLCSFSGCSRRYFS